MTQRNEGKEFWADVFPAELGEIRRRRRRAGVGDPPGEGPTLATPSVSHQLIGLAFSGGGIRSASFSLGVAQYLIEAGLFKTLDYLSTVSGGGYTGSCLSALMHRGPGGERLLVDRDGTSEPPALNHLRNCSNYLLSGGALDLLRVPALLMAGVLQTCLLIAPIIIVLVFLTELLFEIEGLFALQVPPFAIAIAVFTPFATAVLLRPLFDAGWPSWTARDRADRRLGLYLLFALGSLVAVPVLAGVGFLVDSDLSAVAEAARAWIYDHAQRGVRSWVMWLVLALAVALVVGLVRMPITVLTWALGALGPLLLIGLYLFGCVYVITSPDVRDSLASRYTGALTANPFQPEQLREAVDRILIAKKFDPANYSIDYSSINQVDPRATTLILTRRSEAEQIWWQNHASLRWLSTRDQERLSIRLDALRYEVLVIPELSLLHLNTEWVVYIAAAVLWLFNYLFVNVNRISLGPFYRDRLSRTFLVSPGAGDLMPADQLRLSELCGEDSWAPYHLVNAALNLQGSSDPQLRQRKTVPFLFSTCFCGSDYTGYGETERLEELDPVLNLGTAMAVSAAAAGPTMGVMTVRALAFVLVLLNVRLAYWLPHPAKARRSAFWQRIMHRNPGLGALLAEATGSVSDRSRFINCSDGGHIENLGIYQLLKRRCSIIVCVDGGTDPEFKFFDFTTMQRYAAIDLGATIDIDLEPLIPGPSGVSKQHHAVGTITYHDGSQGKLVFLKLSCTGDEPEYLSFYKRTVTAFPQEPTTDQFFDETKFEVYRALGYHVAQDTFANAAVRDLLNESSRRHTSPTAEAV